MGRAAAAALVAALVVGAFVFTHSGARATEVCGDHGLARASASSSLFPPGARCIGGTDSPDIVKFDATFLLVVPAAYLLIGLGTSTRTSTSSASPEAALRRRTRRSSIPRTTATTAASTESADSGGAPRPRGAPPG